MSHSVFVYLALLPLLQVAIGSCGAVGNVKRFRISANEIEDYFHAVNTLFQHNVHFHGNGSLDNGSSVDQYCRLTNLSDSRPMVRKLCSHTIRVMEGVDRAERRLFEVSLLQQMTVLINRLMHTLPGYEVEADALVQSGKKLGRWLREAPINNLSSLRFSFLFTNNFKVKKTDSSDYFYAVNMLVQHNAIFAGESFYGVDPGFPVAYCPATLRAKVGPSSMLHKLCRYLLYVERATRNNGNVPDHMKVTLFLQVVNSIDLLKPFLLGHEPQLIKSVDALLGVGEPIRRWFESRNKVPPSLNFRVTLGHKRDMKNKRQRRADDA